MKKLFGTKEKDTTTFKESPPTSIRTVSNSGTTTGMERIVYSEPTVTVVEEEIAQPQSGTVVYEKKTIVDEPIRHESVRGGVKETFRHPIDAFKGQPRDRSPDEIRRKEYIEREIAVPKEKEVKKEIRKSSEGTGVTQSLGNERPKSAKDLRSEFRKEPLPKEYISREPMKEYIAREPMKEYVTEPFVIREPIIVKEPAREYMREADYVEKAPVFIETREKGPVIKEHIHPKEREEIQPVIHREREKTEFIEVTKPILERNVMPTQFQEKTLPAETRATVYQGESEQFKQSYKLATERYKASVEVAPTEREVVEKAPIIKEHITKRVIEEIQPVIYREVTEPHIILETRPIYEKVVEGPTLVEKGEMLPEEFTRTRVKEYPKEYPKEYSREYTREQLKEQPREYVREQPREYSREQLKEQPREYIREQPREYIREQPREYTREQLKEQPKEYIRRSTEYKEYKVPKEYIEYVVEPTQTESRSEEYYKNEPEIREYYNDQGKLVREYSYREGEFAKPLRLKRTETPITETPETKESETRG